MSSMSPQVPRSATSIYGGIVAVVTTITVSIILFRKLQETRNKSRDKCISKQGHSNTSQPPFADQDARDKHKFDISKPAQTPLPQLVDRCAGNEGQLDTLVPPYAALPTISGPQVINQDARDEYKLNVSIPAQVSITSLPQSVGHSARDEGQLCISVPSHAPPTTSEPQFKDQDVRDEYNFDISISGQASTTPQPRPNDHSAGDEGQLSISVPSQIPSTTSEPQFIDQNTKDKNTSIPAQEPIASRPHRYIGSKGVPSITLSQDSLNFKISETNATVVLNGDGQFSKIQRKLAWDCIANLPNINNNLKEHTLLIQSIATLPRAEAGIKDYRNKKSESCFKGTRVALLREMADCVTCSSETRMYVLSGQAGIGKSTVAYTVASRAAGLNLLGASFFFSRGEADRNNAKKFFTTIAYQLCVYNETFSKAIGDILTTERGYAATTKDPQDQLQALILDPLRSIVQLLRFRPILIVVDALDECDEEEAISVLTGLSQLVQDLPPFRVILTTRPQLYLGRFWSNQEGHKSFQVQDIEDKVVGGDIRIYLDHNLSMKQVQKSYPMWEWCASAEEIDSLVCGAGNFFIIASMAVRYILDKTASNPPAQMQQLLCAFAQDRAPCNDLDYFYTAILRDVVPVDCDDDGTVGRYQSVVGAIISVQPLFQVPVSTLSHIIDIDVEGIHAVLDKLQSVILLGSDDVPRVYHKSFPDYLTDQARCKDPHLRIDPRICHTQIVTHCFDIMEKYLKYNILGFGNPARFMSNKDGLEEDGITDEQLEEKIPQQLRYACVYWIKHLESANTENIGLVNRLETFLDKHILHWFEVLSLIGKLDTAHPAVLTLLGSFSDFHQLLSDSLCFIEKFYELIKQSALHTYYSALPFTPTDSLLHFRYINEVVHNIYRIEGGPEKWDALVANLSHGEQVDVVKFSLDSTLFVSSSEGSARYGIQGKLKIWDAATDTLICTVPGDTFALSNDFSMIASSQLNIATLYNANGSPSGTVLTTSSKIEKLALSSESSRVAAALSDGTIWLWDSRNADLIGCCSDGSGDIRYWPQLQFSPTGSRLVFWSADGISLLDVIREQFITDLRCHRSTKTKFKFEFSGDGSRFASLSYDDNSLTLWNSENGSHIGVARPERGLFSRFSAVKNKARSGSWRCSALSTKGSLIATADDAKVTLWTEESSSSSYRSDRSLRVIENLEIDLPRLMAFSPDKDNILAIATTFGIVKLYNVTTHSFVSTLSLGGFPTALAFSPDCTRLAFGNEDGNVNLLNNRDIDVFGPPSKKPTPITALTFSRDCSRLACGFNSGTVELWETNPTMRRIASHEAHYRSVPALGFSPDGGLFASGSVDGTIRLWDDEDMLSFETLNTPSGLGAVALSNSVLVAAGDGVTLWSLDTLTLLHAFTETHYETPTISFAENNALIAVAHRQGVSLFDAENHTTIAALNVPHEIHTMTFLPNNLQLVAQSKDGVFLSFNLVNKHIMKGATLEHLIQLPNISLWHGVPIWHCLDNEQHYFTALFSQDKSPVPVLRIPRHIPVTAWTQGSSMIALGCQDGRVILLRTTTDYLPA